MKFAICNEIYQDWSLADAFAHAARTGYQGVELAPFTLAPSVDQLSANDRVRIRDLAARAGLEVVGLHWLLVKPEGLHLTAPDPNLRAKTSRYFVSLVDACADLGGKVMVIGSPKQRNIVDGVSAQQAWDWAAEALRDPLRQAEDRDVTLCLEPLSPTETNFINSAAQAIRFVRQFHSPRFQIILDVKAMCSENQPIPQIIADSRGCFAHFHANDRNLRGPGSGDVDFAPIAAALRAAQYDGWVSVEVFKFDEGPDVIARGSLEYLRRTFATH